MSIIYFRVLVAALFASLSSSDFRVRNFSYKSLSSVVLYLKSDVEESSHSKCPHVRFLCHALNEKRMICVCLRVLRVIRQHNSGKIPWIDMLPKKYPCRGQILHKYLSVARIYTKTKHDIWDDYREATRLFISDLIICERRNPVFLLLSMVENERVWKSRN